MRIREYNASLDKRAELLVYYTEKQNSDMETKKETKKNTRLLSLDTLRGFDMLFIMGFAPLVVALNALHPTAVGDVIAGHMRHVPWDGFTQHDMIFPLFLFIAGISFPFSLAKQRGSGSSDKHIYLRVFRRGEIGRAHV